MSRHGAHLELARILVSRGVPDQPVSVINYAVSGVTPPLAAPDPETGSRWLEMRRIPGAMVYPRLSAMATWTMLESISAPVRRVRWKPPPDFIAARGIRNAQNRGEAAPPAPLPYLPRRQSKENRVSRGLP